MTAVFATKALDRVSVKPVSVRLVSSAFGIVSAGGISPYTPLAMSPLERILARVNRHGDANHAATPRPMLTLEEFFEGNNVIGSICCNCSPPPTPSDVYEILRHIRARQEVADVRVQVTELDERWPFSDMVWIITTAAPVEVKAWFPEQIAPDECWAGWQEGVRVEPISVANGYRPIACWWD